MTWVTHALNGATRWFNYGYDNVGNRTWTRRWNGQATLGDVFGYDLNDQVSAVRLNIANPDTTPPGAQTIFYDANGNRTTFAPYGTTEQYVTNNLNQYSSRNATNAGYDFNANLATGVDGSTYTYDAQNRLLTANKAGITATFKYDGLNRQVKRIAGGATTYSVWDGWDLVQEYQGGGSVTANYLSGASGLVKNLVTNNYYYQDGSGSTSHLASSGGALLEWYRYDLQGTPIFYNAANVQIGGSNQGVRHLFTGQQWYSELGLYDLRDRFYSPDIGRFLQPDPIGFAGDPTNLYRYCGNNPVNWSDPNGLERYYPGMTKPFPIGPMSPSDQAQFWAIMGPIVLIAAPWAFVETIGVSGALTIDTLVVWGAQAIQPHHWTQMPPDEEPPPGTAPLYRGLPAPGHGASGGNDVHPIQVSGGNFGGFGSGVTISGNPVGSPPNSWWQIPTSWSSSGGWSNYVPYWGGNPFIINPGVTYPDGNGGTFHMGTTGNIYPGPGPTAGSRFGGSEGPSGSGGYMPSGLAGAGSPSQTELALYGGPYSTGWGTFEWQRNFWGSGK